MYGNCSGAPGTLTAGSKSVGRKEFLAQPGSEQRRNFELVDPNKRVTVTIYGQQSSTLALQPEEVKPYIDVSKLTEPGIYTVSISCYVKGDRLDVKDIVPDKIRVKITDRK